MAAIPEPVADLIRREAESPGSVEDVLGRVEDAYPEMATLWRFLALKDDQYRHALYIRIQHVFLRRLGWRLMRPLFLLALVAAAISAFQDLVDPTLALGLFLCGSASFYAVLQFFLHRWAWRDMKKLSGLEREYAGQLSQLLETDD